MSQTFIRSILIINKNKKRLRHKQLFSVAQDPLCLDFFHKSRYGVCGRFLITIARIGEIQVTCRVHNSHLILQPTCILSMGVIAGHCDCVQSPCLKFIRLVLGDKPKITFVSTFIAFFFCFSSYIILLLVSFK